jgi:hypothetical protein
MDDAQRIGAGRCNHLTFSTKAWCATFLFSKKTHHRPGGFLKRSRLFCNKSLVRSFSSFENLFIGPEVSQAFQPVFQQKPGMQLFFFRETSPSARSSLKPR